MIDRKHPESLKRFIEQLGYVPVLSEDLTCDRLVRTWIAGWARFRSRVALAKSSAVAGRLSRDAGVASVHDPSAGCSGQGRSLGWMERARALPVRGQGFSHLEQ